MPLKKGQAFGRPTNSSKNRSHLPPDRLLESQRAAAGSEEAPPDHPQNPKGDINCVAADLQRLEISENGNDNFEVIYDVEDKTRPGWKATMLAVAPHRQGIQTTESDDLFLEYYFKIPGRRNKRLRGAEKREPPTTQEVQRFAFPSDDYEYEVRLFREVFRIEVYYRYRDGHQPPDQEGNPTRILAATLKSNGNNLYRSRQLWVECKRVFKYMSLNALKYINVHRPLLEASAIDTPDEPFEISIPGWEPMIFPGWLTRNKVAIERYRDGTAEEGQDKPAGVETSQPALELSNRREKRVERRAAKKARKIIKAAVAPDKKKKGGYTAPKIGLAASGPAIQATVEAGPSSAPPPNMNDKLQFPALIPESERAVSLPPPPPAPASPATEAPSPIVNLPQVSQPAAAPATRAAAPTTAVPPVDLSGLAPKPELPANPTPNDYQEMIRWTNTYEAKVKKDKEDNQDAAEEAGLEAEECRRKLREAEDRQRAHLAVAEDRAKAQKDAAEAIQDLLDLLRKSLV